MTYLPNIAFYRSGMINAQQGIRTYRTLNPLTDAVEPGIILGSRRPRTSAEGRNTFTACDGSVVIWPLCGQTLDIQKNGSLLNASITSIATNGGTEHFLSPHAKDNKCLVLVQTGVQDSRDLRTVTRPLFHGSIPMTDGVREIAAWASETQFFDSDIPTRRMNLYELTPGAELYVGGALHEPDHEARIVIENGVVQVVDVPTNARGLMERHGRELFALAEAKRTQKQAA